MGDEMRARSGLVAAENRWWGWWILIELGMGELNSNWVGYGWWNESKVWFDFDWIRFDFDWIRIELGIGDEMRASSGLGLILIDSIK